MNKKSESAAAIDVPSAAKLLPTRLERIYCAILGYRYGVAESFELALQALELLQSHEDRQCERDLVDDAEARVREVTG